MVRSWKVDLREASLSAVGLLRNAAGSVRVQPECERSRAQLDGRRAPLLFLEKGPDLHQERPEVRVDGSSATV